jgi:ketosteroid isomerase-like protein
MDRMRAEVIVHACHEAWSLGNLTRLLSLYSPNIVYTCNAEPAEGSSVRYVGRAAMRTFLEPILRQVESISVVEAFHFDGVKARTTISTFVKHFQTGIEMNSQYRQVIRFESGLVGQLEEFHDAARLAAFWKLVAHTQAMQTQGRP